MQYTILGQTGLRVSRLGLGCMRFPDNEKEASKVINHAYHNGINLFDTAPVYINSHSEHYIGISLKGKRNKVIISTKATVKSNLKSRDVRQTIERSLKRMQTDYIDIFYLWCVLDINDFHRAKAKNGFLEGVEKAKKEGLIRHIGVSVHVGSREILQVIEEYPFEVILLGYNILNANVRKEGALRAKQKGMGVLAMNPVGGGVLGYDNSDKLKFLKWNTLSGAPVALKWVLSSPHIDVALNGAQSVSMLNSSITSLQQKDMDEIARKQLYNQANNIKTDYCTACGYCKPCPQGVDIPLYLTLLNKYHIGGEQAFKKAFIKDKQMGWIKKENYPNLCTDCGICLDKCTAHLEIPEKLMEVRKIIKTLFSKSN